MHEPLLLNDFLNLSEEDLKRTKVKFNQYNGETEPMELYLQDPDEINTTWLFWRQKRRYFRVGEIAICLFKLTWNTLLLSTIKTVTKDLDVSNGVNYEGEEIIDYSPYFGRVVVKYRKSHQTQCLPRKYSRQFGS